MGRPAQDPAEHLDTEGAPVAAADAQDERRESEGGVHVQRLAQHLSGVLAYGADPVGTADHDQRQQLGMPDRVAQRLLTDPPVAVAECEREPCLVEPGRLVGQRGGPLPPRQEPRALPHRLTHPRVQREPVAGIGDIERLPKRRTSRQPHRRCRPALNTLDHARPSTPCTA